MGGGVGTICGNCEHISEYLFGVGMLYSSIDRVAHLLPKGAQRLIADIRSKQEITQVDYAHKLYECPSCDTTHPRFYLSFRYGENQMFQPDYRCGDCWGPLRVAQKDIFSYRCRKCGARQLRREFEICPWD
ncbi:MAG: hypothetical protein NZ730_10550 [Porticoccaceae bacterium]|nr:hypothetical protein [Porticoccaceae bacterium]